MGNRREEKGGISENNSKKIFITSIVSIVLFSISLALPAFAMTVQFDHTVPPDDWYYVDHGAVIIVDASVDYDQYRDPNTAPANTQQVLNVIISATGGDSINVQLTETSATSGFFTFTPYVMFTSGANNQNTPALHVDVNDIVTTAVQSPPAGIIPIEEAVNIISAGDGAWPPTGTFLGNKSVKLTGTDSDLDGIVDSWETTTGLQIPYNGITYTYPCNSSISYDCPVVGKKDVYIEIDYMRRHAPNPDALNDVILAFRAQDIRLHIQTDEEIPHHANSMTGPAAGGAGGTDFDKAKDTYFGSSSDRTNGNLLTAKRQVFHYALFGHNLSTGFSGTSEIPGNDNAITLGKWAGAVGSRDQQAGTFMHELGHNLRLYHGGSDNTNCKPNYLSVMSYSRQFSDYVANRPLTFSSGANTALDEDSYIETNGIGTANSGQVTAFGPTPILTATVGGGINWDRDANTEGTTQTAWKDLNNFGTSSGCDGAPAPPTPSYSDVNDWARLTYDIKVPTSFGDGAPIGEGCDDHGCPFIVEPADEVTEEGSVPEIDGTEYIESIVPKLKFVEYDEEINSVIPIINQEQNGDQTCKCDGVDEKIKNQTDTQYNSYIDADNDSSELPKQEMNITQSRQFRILHIQAIDSAIMKLLTAISKQVILTILNVVVMQKLPETHYMKT